MKIGRNIYLQAFSIVVILLAIGRIIFIDQPKDSQLAKNDAVCEMSKDSLKKDSTERVEEYVEEEPEPVVAEVTAMPVKRAKHRVKGVRSFTQSFPDAQDVQIVAANKWGVSPVQNREEAERRKAELVYVGSNPYFFVEPLYQSIPYLVPRASVLLQDIGRNYFDSLQIKGLPLHKIIVTSVMRTKEDISRLRRHNGNAVENSCHMFGTTFDITYNRYLRVEEVDSAYSKKRTIADVRLMQVLSEVLDDLRRDNRCYVKYEHKQSCFHITVR